MGANRTMSTGERGPTFDFDNDEIDRTTRTISNVEKGTTFELLTENCLSKWGFRLRRVGGANDRGVDLRGYWMIPKPVFPKTTDGNWQPVVVQCKAYKTKVMPSDVREMKGTLSQESAGTLAILASSAGFSKKAMDDMYGAETPLVLAVIKEGGICQRFILVSIFCSN